MIERSKLAMIFVFAICFLAYSFLLGKFYDKFHISRTLWIVICAVLTGILAIVFIWDLFFAKNDTDDGASQK